MIGFKTYIPGAIIGLVFALPLYADVDRFYQNLLDPAEWTLHTQATTVSQGHFPFHSPYAGPNSLAPLGEGRTSFTSTEFIGRRLWRGGSVYFNPEILAG